MNIKIEKKEDAVEDVEEGDESSGSSQVQNMRGVSSEENVEDVFSVPPDQPHVITIRDPLSRGRSDHTFLFSNVLMPESTQQRTFETVCKPLVDHVLSGFNACCFAYGQTSSGKTYTIFGEGSQERRGMLPRAVEYLFEKIDEYSERKEIGK